MLYNLSIITPPAEEPVTFAELRQQIRDVRLEEKTLVERYARESREMLEGVCRLTMVSTVYEVQYDDFNYGELKLPARPVLSAADVASVKYLDSNGAEQTLSPSLYTVNVKQPYSTIVFDSEAVLPTLDDVPNAVRIRFTAGYGDASAVPDALKVAIAERTATKFENRESIIVGKTIATMPYGFDVIVRRYSAPEAY